MTVVELSIACVGCNMDFSKFIVNPCVLAVIAAYIFVVHTKEVAGDENDLVVVLYK